jgi:hypothetical protein
MDLVQSTGGETTRDRVRLNSMHEQLLSRYYALLAIHELPQDRRLVDLVLYE